MHVVLQCKQRICFWHELTVTVINFLTTLVLMCINAWTDIIILSVYTTIQTVVAQSVYGVDQYNLYIRVQGRKARHLAQFVCIIS